MHYFAKTDNGWASAKINLPKTNSSTDRIVHVILYLLLLWTISKKSDSVVTTYFELKKRNYLPKTS